jgi:hypothetical protein
MMKPEWTRRSDPEAVSVETAARQIMTTTGQDHCRLRHCALTAARTARPPLVSGPRSAGDARSDDPRRIVRTILAVSPCNIGRTMRGERGNKVMNDSRGSRSRSWSEATTAAAFGCFAGQASKSDARKRPATGSAPLAAYPSTPSSFVLVRPPESPCPLRAAYFPRLRSHVRRTEL